MRASVRLDDDLLKTAHEYTGITERAKLLREALKSIIAREAGRRLLLWPGLLRRSKMCAGARGFAQLRDSRSLRRGHFQHNALSVDKHV